MVDEPLVKAVVKHLARISLFQRIERSDWLGRVWACLSVLIALFCFQQALGGPLFTTFSVPNAGTARQKIRLPEWYPATE